MRTFAIACAMGLVCSATAFAQGRSLGVKAGVTLATQRNTGEAGIPSLQSRIGLVAGAFATLPLFSWLELQPEVLYTTKGAKVDLDGIKASVAVDYLEVPVLLRFSRRGAGRLHYYVAGGPSAGFQLRARTRTKFAGSTEEMDISDQVERFDLGVAFGGGVEIGSIVIDGRYTLGLTDIDKDKRDRIKTTNRALSLTAGFRF